MVGPLIYGFSEDAVAAAKVMSDFAKSNDKLVVKGGAYAGKALDVNGVKALATIPSQGSAAGPVARPDAVADLAHWPRVLAALAEKRGGGGAAAEAPGRSRHRPLEPIASSTFNRILGNPKWHSIKTHS